jgi:SAM-dependent methyltransferase
LNDVSPAALFGHIDDQTWRWLHLEAREQCPFLGDYLPSLPPDELQAQIASLSGDAALRHGFEAYELFKRLAGDYRHPLEPSDAVLDFGCGWGRIIRFFIRDVEPENLWGIDVDEIALEACRDTNRWARFEHVDSMPPSHFDDGTFDLIYAFSVFSHLSEECHLAWLKEFERILKRGGVFVSTTLSRHLIEQSEDYASHDLESLPPWQRHLAEAFSPPDEFLALYDRGDYCFAPITGTGEHYGLACIPETYVRRHWARRFQVRQFFTSDPLGQVVIVSTKP